MTDSDTRLAKRRELWATIREAVAELDALGDEWLREQGEDVTEGQMLGPVVLAYSTSAINDEGRVTYATAYLVPPDNVAPETSLGLFDFAAARIRQDVIG